MTPVRLTLYSRSYCHLCEDMLAALEVLRGELSFEIEILDVDSDPILEREYNEFVPVLTVNGKELCHHILDESEIRKYLGRRKGDI
jgi:glutaredoxin